MLLSAYRLGQLPKYDSWRQEHREAEQTLKTNGLLHTTYGPHHASVHPDILFSLDVCDHKTVEAPLGRPTGI